MTSGRAAKSGGEGAHPGDARLHRPRAGESRPSASETDVFNLGATMYWALTGRNIPTLYTAARGTTRSCWNAF